MKPTYFYANTRFEGEWSQIAAFVKGIAARRRDMIRSLEISHPSPTAFGSEGAEVLELLSALANLRIVRLLLRSLTGRAYRPNLFEVVP